MGHPNGEEASDGTGPVTVRLLLPTGDTVTSQFEMNNSVASVLVAHSTYIRERIGDLGPEEECVIKCEDKVLVPGQLTAPLSSLDQWVWCGDPEIHLEYQLRPSSLHIDIEEDRDLEQHERVLKRLTKLEGVNKDDLINSARTMNQDRNNLSPSSNPVLEELLVASKHPDNPFHCRQFPFDVNTSTYATMMTFIKEQMPRTYHWVIQLRVGSHQSDEKDVIAAAQLVGQMMAMVSPKNSALAATKSVTLKSGGLTNSALDATQRSSFCQSSSSYRRKRQQLAGLADSLAQKAVSQLGSIPAFVIDNLNMKGTWCSYDFTQCILMYKDVDITGITHSTLLNSS